MQYAQVSRQHIGHTGQAQHKCIASPTDITLSSSRVKLIRVALSKEEEKKQGVWGDKLDKEGDYLHLCASKLCNRALTAPL